MNKIKSIQIAILAVLIFVIGTTSYAFTGSLSGDNGGILGTGVWVDKSFLNQNEQQSWTAPFISWIVTQNANKSWHYSYTFNVYKGETSHFILETSKNFTRNDIFNAEGEFRTIEVGWNSSGDPGNPNLPADIYGIKFDSTSGLSLNISFDSFRVPVWGDFYAKDGKVASNIINTAWNAGLLNADPTCPASDGSVGNKILVPDTVSEVPEPSSILATLTGLIGIVGTIVRRRN